MKKNRPQIYMDYAAAAPLDPAVFCAMKKYLTGNFSNPGAIHRGGVEAGKGIEAARRSVARILGAQADEIFFTGSGTESNNLAILGSAPGRIITTNIEHPSVLGPAKKLGAKIVPVEKNGIVRPEKIREEIDRKTVLVSIIYANNEIGTVQPIQEIAKIVRAKRKEYGTRTPYLHVDATQAMNYLPVRVDRLGVDLLSFNGSKIYGPKGIGALYKKRSVELRPIMSGGGQEAGLRPGTENVAGIAGLAKALEIAETLKEKEYKRLIKLRNYFAGRLLVLQGVVINGDMEERLPNNLSISVENMDGELLVIELDAKGVLVSAKSACEKDKGESHVIEAIRSRTLGSVRFSLGRETTKGHIDYTVKALRAILTKYKKLV